VIERDGALTRQRDSELNKSGESAATRQTAWAEAKHDRQSGVRGSSINEKRKIANGSEKNSVGNFKQHCQTKCFEGMT
jgi:hypothetical protein